MLNSLNNDEIFNLKKPEGKKLVPTILEDKGSLTFSSAAVTDPGRKRKVNEDAVFQQTRRLHSGQRMGLYLVCDGMGGHRAGDVASRLAVETVSAKLDGIHTLLETLPDYDRPLILRQYIRAAIARANSDIREYAQTHAETAAGLGTTITLAFIHEDVAQIANVGDGRVYIWRAGKVVQITQDHSFAAQLAQLGLIDESEIANHPRSNLISRALGMEDEVEIDLFNWELQPGDKLLLCTDGLWKTFPEPAKLAGWLGSRLKPETLNRQLVTEAINRDGSDNVSAVLVSVAEAASY